MAYYGSKGWYVAELKKLGIRNIDGKKLESFKAYILAAELRRVKGE